MFSSRSQLLDSDLIARSPAFASLAPMLARLDLSSFPSRAQLQRLLDEAQVVNANGGRIELVAAASPHDQRASYEHRVYDSAEVEQREHSVHDFFNAMIWATLPHAKAALNRRHVAAMASESPGRRGPMRDALTAFDEDGLVVVSSEPSLLDLLHDFQWKTLFWTRRAEALRCMRWFVFGHAQYEKFLTPYVGMTAKALTFEVSESFICSPIARQLEDIDAQLARSLRDDARLSSPRGLAPVPVLGIPGWWAANADEIFYDDANYFRAGRLRASASAASAQPRGVP
ncbi:MAG: DUF3025 domain-containing protein [Betaproteobacteria bacterium]